uniref:Peptidase M12B domain-containing protein n=1 Tax=Elaeophora elaphi TaxID=1147741 RepID=A0A0R3RGZ5_9BILA
MSRNFHGNGNATLLLDLFCAYQAKINRNINNVKRWDHALLFTGYDLYRDEVRTLAGYAPVNGMCSENKSCTIIEGLDFSAVFIIAHEMGHNLGMKHDGENGCDESCCIMSTSIGTGRTLWSSCSVQELNHLIDKLNEKNATKNCLRTTGIRRKRMPKILPGQMYTLDEQCILFHGTCWKHEIRHGEDISDVCKMIWCSNGEGIIRSAHPALEYSYCGYRMWCIEGGCKPAIPEVAIPRHGGWSEWTEGGHGSCITECIPCQVNGQLRVRRSTRLCDNPYPNNGGSYCIGDDTRGIRCQINKCNGPSIEEFATKSCTKLRDSNDPSTRNLTGEGMQYTNDLCKIWCLLSNGQIRTTSIFPDGTPCGIERYCVKGRCRKLNCNGRGIVEFSLHCPKRNRILQNGFIQSKQKHVKIAMTNATNERIQQS